MLKVLIHLVRTKNCRIFVSVKEYKKNPLRDVVDFT